MNYDQLKKIVRLKVFTAAEAEQLSHLATREILDARKGRLLQEELVETLGNIAVGNWLGPKVAESLRDRAVGIIDNIELAAGHASNSSGTRRLASLQLFKASNVAQARQA